MIRFAAVIPNRAILSTLLRELSWTYSLVIVYLKNLLQHDFFADMYRVERWGTRTLGRLEQQVTDLATIFSTRITGGTQ